MLSEGAVLRIRYKSAVLTVWLLSMDILIVLGLALFLYYTGSDGISKLYIVAIIGYFIIRTLFHFFLFVRVNLVFDESGIRQRKSPFGINNFIFIPWEDVKFLVYENIKNGRWFPLKAEYNDNKTIEFDLLNKKTGPRAMELISRYIPEEKFVDVSTRYVKFEESEDDE